MGVTSFQLVDNQTFLPADLSNGKLFVSPDQINGTGQDLSTGIRVTIDYHELVSVPAGATLQALVEGKSVSGQYSILAYQFEEFNRTFEQKRQIVMAPFLQVIDTGVDNIIFVGGTVVERISGQTGILTPTWRVSINLKDTSTPQRFVSARLSVYGERFNQQTLPVDFNNILTDKDGTFITTQVN